MSTCQQMEGNAEGLGSPTYVADGSTAAVDISSKRIRLAPIADDSGQTVFSGQALSGAGHGVRGALAEAEIADWDGGAFKAAACTSTKCDDTSASAWIIDLRTAAHVRRVNGGYITPRYGRYALWVFGGFYEGVTWTALRPFPVRRTTFSSLISMNPSASKPSRARLNAPRNAARGARTSQQHPKLRTRAEPDRISAAGQ